jgi:hypothetical protein
MDRQILSSVTEIVPFQYQRVDLTLAINMYFYRSMHFYQIVMYGLNMLK